MELREARLAVSRAEAPFVLLWAAGLLAALSVLSMVVEPNLDAANHLGDFVAAAIVAAFGLIVRRTAMPSPAVPWIVAAGGTLIGLTLMLELSHNVRPQSFSYVFLVMVVIGPVCLDWRAFLASCAALLAGLVATVVSADISDPAEWVLIGVAALLVSGVLLAFRLRSIDDTARSSEQLSITLDSLIDPHFIVAPILDADGQIADFATVYANRAMLAYFTWSAEQARSVTMRTIDPAPLPDTLIDAFEQVLHTGVPYALDGLELMLHGEVRFLDIRAVRVQDRVAVTFRDVTQFVEDERALAESEALFRLLAENASDVVYQADAQGKITWITPSISPLLGWDPQAMIGTEGVDVVVPEDRAAILANRPRLYAGESSEGTVVRALTADGQSRYVSVSSRPIRDADGNPAGIVVGVRDVDELVRARNAAEATAHHLQAIADSALDPQATLQAIRSEAGDIVDFAMIDANRAAIEYLRLTREELSHQTIVRLLRGADVTDLVDALARTVDTGDPTVLTDWRLENPAFDSARYFDVRATRLDDGVTLAWSDVSARSRAAKALAISERHYRLLAENTGHVVVWARPPEGIVWVSPSLWRVLGIRPEEWIGKGPRDLYHPDDAEGFLAAIDAAGRGESPVFRGRVKDGHGVYHWIEGAVQPYVDETGQVDGRVTSFRLFDDEVLAEQRLDRMARFDTLTGLMNRAEIIAQLTRMRGPQRRTGGRTAVLFCDIDHFKETNDTLGHAAGDQVLRVLSTRVQQCLRRDDLAARFGGDEILVLLQGVHTIEEAAAVAEKIRLAALAPIRLAIGEATTSLSIGVTMAGTDETVDQITARADHAMYQAKRTGRNQVISIDA
jgi:diguanylate cyclase (GGDEF)-like protein/PAS domain S-box-containing protein